MLCARRLGAARSYYIASFSAADGIAQAVSHAMVY